MNPNGKTASTHFSPPKPVKSPPTKTLIEIFQNKISAAISALWA